jgi:putative spermidine/putrescine transport system ATP-binding protein
MALLAGGTRLVQAVTAGAPRLALGAPGLLALRPEKISLLAPGEAADTEVNGTITAWSYHGTGFALAVQTVDLGVLQVALPAWRAPIAPAEGMAVRLGWSSDASVPVAEDSHAA